MNLLRSLAVLAAVLGIIPMLFGQDIGKKNAAAVGAFSGANTSQSISWIAPSGPALGLNRNYALMASASSGLPVAFNLLSGPAVLSGTNLVVTNLGTVAVVASQSGNSTFLPAAVTNTFNPTDALLTQLASLPKRLAGNPYGIKIVGNRAYIASGSGGLNIFDISSPDSPQPLGSVILANAQGVDVTNNVAFVANGLEGLSIIDATNPSNPQLKASVSFNGFARGIRVVGSKAYIAAHDSGLQIIDVGITSAPKLISSVSFPGGAACAVDVAGTFAYVAAQAAGLQVVDVSSASAPAIVGRESSIGYAEAVQVSGTTAYVGGSGLQLVDVSIPGKPSAKSSLVLPNVHAVQVVSNLVFLGSDDGLDIVDTSIPSNPAVLSAGSPSGATYSVQTSGPRIFLAQPGTPTQGPNISSTLVVANISTPALPTGTRSINMGEGSSFGLQVVTNLAYVADVAAGLEIFDITQPTNRILLGSVSPAGGAAYSVKLSGPNAFLADGNAGLQVIDVSQSANPFVVGSAETIGGPAIGLDISGPVAAVACGSAGMQIFDITAPSAPVRLSITGGKGGPPVNAVCLAGSLAYVAAGGAGLEVFDISNPSSPVLLSTLGVQGGIAVNLQVVGTIVYLLDALNGLLSIDITFPENPILIGQMATGSFFDSGLHVRDEFAYLDDGFGGILVFDITTPGSPRKCGSVTGRGGSTKGIQVSGNNLYVTDGLGGLQVAQQTLQLKYQVPQSISLIVSPDIVVTNTFIPVTATADSGLPVAIAIISGPATVSGGQVIIGGLGTVTLEATQTGDSIYLPATPVRATVNVTNRRPVVANPISDPTPVIYGSSFSLQFPTNTFFDADGDLLTYSAFGLPPGVLFDPATRSLAGTPTLAGIYPAGVVATAVGVPSLTATNLVTITVDPAPLSISASPSGKTYGDTDPILPYSVSGLLGTDTAESVLSGALARAPGENVVGAPYGIIQGTLTANSNYAVQFTGSSFSITPAPLLVTADAKTKVYGQSDPPLTYVAAGLKFSDGPGTVLTGALARTPGEGVTASPYPILKGTLAANSNYLLSFVPSSLTISKAPLSITAADKTKVYGSTDPVFTVNYSGFVNGDNASVLGGTLSLNRSPGERVGSYPITPDGLTSKNYTLSFNAGSLSITSPGVVLGRYLFYNQSGYDGGDAGATTNDDLAIASDKVALQRGQIATFTNYTSYSRGINGIMVDLVLAGTPDVSDFVFKIGNNNAPDGWSNAPAPSIITVRTNAGVNSSDRVTLIWSNNVIQKEWLEVTVRATTNTALNGPDTFYFGNAIGETGNSAVDARVSVLDLLRTRANFAPLINSASINNPYDFDRDRKVNVQDILITRANTSTAVTSLKLIDLSAVGPLKLNQVIHPMPGSANSLAGGGNVRLASLARQPLVPVIAEGNQVRLDGWMNSDGTFSLQLTGEGASDFRLEASSAPAGATWVTISPESRRETSKTVFRWTVPTKSAAAQRFYRAVR